MQRTEFGDIRSACGFLNILYLNKKKKREATRELQNNDME